MDPNGLVKLCALAVLTFFGLTVKAVTAFGENIFVQIGWRLLAEVGVTSANLVEPVFVLTVVSLPLMSFQAWVLRKHCNFRLAVVWALSASLGSTVGVALLYALDSTWLQRALGLVLLFVFCLTLLAECQASGGRAADVSPNEAKQALGYAPFSSPGRAIAILSTGLLSGLLGGLFAIPGPPTMLFALYARIGKDELRGTCAAQNALQLSVRLAALFALRNGQEAGPLGSETQLMDLGLASAVSLCGGFFGLLFGNRLAKRIDHQQFRDAILVFLLVGGASMVSADFGTTVEVAVPALCATAGALYLGSSACLRWRRRAQPSVDGQDVGTSRSIAVMIGSPVEETEAEPILVNLWSGPRCLSTAMMYAWAQRPDCEVFDEPLQAHFFRTHPEKPRPYRDLVLSEMDSDGDAVVDMLLDASRGPRVRMVKHIAKQSRGLMQDSPIFASSVPSGHRRSLHAILVRDPEALLTSFAKVLPATLDETSYTDLSSIYDKLAAEGRAPPVLLAKDLETDPEGALRKLCAALDVPFDPRMLSWPPGPKPYDGAWAPWWYASAHASCGWGASGQRNREGKAAADGHGRPEGDLPVELRELLAECEPLYARLRSEAEQIPPGTPASGSTTPPSSSEKSSNEIDSFETLA